MSQIAIEKYNESRLVAAANHAAKPSAELAPEPSNPAQPDRRHWALLALILLAGTALRLLDWGRQSFWYDELYSIWASRLPLDRLVDEVAASGHPPLYYLVAHFWYEAGAGEHWAQLLSVLAGIATIVLTYLLGRELISRRAGLWGAALAAASPFLIWYAREATFYSWLTALSIASLLFLVRGLKRDGWGNWTAFIGFSTATIFTFYFSLVLLVAAMAIFWIFWVLEGRDQRSLTPLSLSLMVLMAAFATSRVLGHAATGWGDPAFPGALPLAKVLLSGLGASPLVLLGGGAWFARNSGFAVLLGFSLKTLLAGAVVLTAGLAGCLALSRSFRRWLLTGSTLVLLNTTLMLIAGPIALLMFIGRDPSPRFYLWAPAAARRRRWRAASWLSGCRATPAQRSGSGW